MTLQFSATIRDAQNNAITTAIGASGLLRHYSGTIPANVAAAITGTLLDEQVMNATYAPGSSSGVMTLNSIANANATATGTASHYRKWQSNGTTGHEQGSVGTTATDLVMNTVSYVSGGPVAVSSWVHTAGGA